jgi:hypothetical protein
MVDGVRNFHAVRFYYDSGGLCQIVSDFLAEGLNAGEPSLVVATPHHAARVESLLNARGFDVASLKRAGEFVVKNASEMLSKMMVDNAPDQDRFRRLLAPAIQAVGGETRRTVRVYGEIVDLLWRAGQTGAATQLEALWNTLATSHPFVLLCAYALEGVGNSSHISQICGQHTHIVTASGDVALAH